MSDKIQPIATVKIQPIATAPRDGSTVFVVDDTGTIATAKWTGSMWAYANTGDLIEQIDFEPTGWVREPADFLP